MPTSADLVQIAIIPEDVYGVTPANPSFLVIRTTGEGLAFAPTTTKSNEMNPARQVTDSILTGGSVTGDLNFEMAHEAWFDDLLAGAFCADWVSNNLQIGTTLKSFTVEKMIPVPGGITQYHRYAGCTVNGFSFDVKPNQAITGSFSLLGKGVTIDTAAIAGATYTNPYLTPVMTAPRVVGVTIGGIPAVSQCFNNLQISMNNNNRAIECIGTLGAKELALGRAEVTATFGVLFSDSTLLQTLLDQTETSLGFQTNDTLTVGSPAAHNYFQWNLPRVKFSANPVVAGGTGQDVVNAVTAEGLLDTASGSAFLVTRSPLIHNLPTVVGTAPNTVTGSSYAYSFGTTGLVGTVTGSVISGALPAGLGLTVSGTHLLVSGTPTGSGTYTFKLRAVGSTSGSADSQTQTIVVSGSVGTPTISGTAPAGTVGVAYSYNFSTSGFVGAITATVGSGTLPAGLGLSVSGTNIVLSGTPTTAASSAFTIHAVGATSGTDDSDPQSVVIAASSSSTTRARTVAAAAQPTDLLALLNSMTVLGGSPANDRTGTITTVSSPSLYQWVAVTSAAFGSGLIFKDVSLATGGWNGANSAGIYSGADASPTVISQSVTDGNGVSWKLVRTSGHASGAAFTLS